MKLCPGETDVVRFLRVALADRRRSVNELEASARAAGLLKERQNIANVRAFREAKSSLAVRSVRAGFGASGLWLWELPRESQGSAKAGRQTTPRRLIPSYWVEGVARLRPDRPPNDVPRHRWAQFVQDFPEPLRKLGRAAYKLGWDAMALFGCAPRRPARL